jgi:hypothetical protein
VATNARAILAAMRRHFPGAVQLVYDNYNALAIGFGASERLADTVFSIALYPRWVSLFFLNGVELDDPEKLLKGSGNRVRHIVLENAAELNRPGIKALMAQALERAEVRFSRAGGRVVIRSISGRQRPRRPVEKKRPAKAKRKAS